MWEFSLWMVGMFRLTVPLAAGSPDSCRQLCTFGPPAEPPCRAGVCLARSPGHSALAVPRGVSGAAPLRDVAVQECCTAAEAASPGIKDACEDAREFRRELAGAPLQVAMDFRVRKVWEVVEAEDHFTADIWLQLSWLDPQLALCRCGEAAVEGRGRTFVLTRPDGVVWVPDLHVWEMREVERKHGLGSRGHLEHLVLRADPATGLVTVTQEVELVAELACHANTTHFPWERNRCLARFGSYSANSSALVFRQASRRLPAALRHPEFRLRLFPLPAVNRWVRRPTAAAWPETFVYDGFTMVVDRGGGRLWRVLVPYGGVAVVLVATSLAGLLMPLQQRIDIGPLFATTLLGLVILFTDATNSTPVGYELTPSPLIAFLETSVLALALGFFLFSLLGQARVEGLVGVAWRWRWQRAAGAAALAGYSATLLYSFLAAQHTADVVEPCHNILH